MTTIADLPVALRHHLPASLTLCVANSGPMRHDLADSASTFGRLGNSASTFAEPVIGQAKVFTGSRT